jgi:hypothetical protein
MLFRWQRDAKAKASVGMIASSTIDTQAIHLG